MVMGGFQMEFRGVFFMDFGVFLDEWMDLIPWNFSLNMSCNAMRCSGGGGGLPLWKVLQRR